MTWSRCNPSLHLRLVSTSLQERPGRPIPQALRRLPYSSASYAGGLDQAMERSKWLLPFLLVDWTTASAAIMTKTSGFAYFIVFTSFLCCLRLRSQLAELLLLKMIQHNLVTV